MYEDFRTEEEKEAEKRAQSPLDSEDEELAKRLVVLVRDAVEIARSNPNYQSDPKHQKLEKDIQDIGEKCCNEGGNVKMHLILYRYKALGGHSSRIVELFWNGICGWMY